jgi:hypothetical protein
VFATLIEPDAFAADPAQQRALLTELGGPLFSAVAEDLATARAEGVATALVLRAPDGAVVAEDLATARACAPDILAVQLPSLIELEGRAEQFGRLAESLAALAGSHRLLLALDAPLPALTAAEWGRLPFESLAIDPLRDPTSWRAAATLPGARGLLLGLVPPPGDGEPEPVEVLLWAVQYAASLGGRGLARVGIAGLPRHRNASVAPVSGPTGGSEGVSASAGDRVALLARTMRLASADVATLRDELDPRALSPIAARVADRQQRDGS